MAFSWEDVGRSLTNVAPTVAGVLTNVLAPGAGPIAAAGVKALLSALGLSEDATPDQAQEAILSGNPETLVALKKLDQDFARDMARIGVDLEQIAAGDRASARQREIAVKDKIPGLLAIILTIGFYGMLGLMSFHALPVENKDTLVLMLGSLATGWGLSMAYYFGSTSGSQQKTAAIVSAVSK